MKKTVLLFLLCFSLSYCCVSQDCELKLRSAMSLFEKGDYYNARNMFAEVVKDCGKGEDYGGALGMIRECESKINKPKKPVLAVGNTNVSFGPQGGTEIVKVTSNTPWGFGEYPDWILLSKNNGQLVIECSVNTSREGRSVDIMIQGEKGSSTKIHITQSRSNISVSPRSITSGELGGTTYLVNVNSNDDWSVVIPSDSWIIVKEIESGVSVSCDENPLAIERRGVFKVVTSGGESVEIGVLQRPSKPKLELDTIVNVAWNTNDYKLRVDSNDPNWSSTVVSGGSWCKIVKQEEHWLVLSFNENDADFPRSAKIEISAKNISKEITITQGVNGYMALYADYFQNIGGKMRITPVSASIYGVGSYGLRVSGYMIRWKVAEIDLLNFNASFSKSFLLSWEPMIRGYLPLQRNGNFWTAYLGVGRCVPVVDVPLKDEYEAKHAGSVLEMGAESKLKWRGYDNISARIFMRIDGYFSLGVALDMYKWK